MAARPPEVQQLVESLRDAIASAAPAGSLTREAAEAARKIFGALDSRTGRARVGEPVKLPVCRHYDAAIAAAGQGPSTTSRVAELLAKIEPRLSWSRRPRSETESSEFRHGHANALVIGPDGLERRQDVSVGVSLMAPGVQYPEHSHSPEELYVVLSAGEWRREGGAWFEPGRGGIVHNPPGIVHSMRAGNEPLLAVWLLWRDLASAG